jgi:murein DD-endopeptidase MepM/ murein hydrolase activator NlpD
MRIVVLILSLLLSACPAPSADVLGTLPADGFDFPVGKPDGEGYYRARGYRANGHLGEDWNGKGGGDTDLGDPVYVIAHGVVVFAQDFKHGWGNVVIVRHAYEEGGQMKYADSLYGHLDQIHVRENQQLHRGQQVGTIGTGGGLYAAHLHLEIRKDLRVGMARHRFPKDEKVYFNPAEFINAHRQIKAPIAVVAVPANTFVPFELTTPADAPAAVPPAKTPDAPKKRVR